MLKYSKLSKEQQEVVYNNYINECKTQTYREDYRGELGIFMVYGDDQSGSYSNSYTPLLAHLSGKFEDCLRVACSLENFTYWSSQLGGRLVKVDVHKCK